MKIKPSEIIARQIIMYLESSGEEVGDCGECGGTHTIKKAESYRDKILTISEMVEGSK